MSPNRAIHREEVSRLEKAGLLLRVLVPYSETLLNFWQRVREGV